jgi:flagellar biosynthesis/type III secretory pathway ATPase
LDLAVALWPKMTEYIRQGANEARGFSESQQSLIQLMGE